MTSTNDGRDRRDVIARERLMAIQDVIETAASYFGAKFRLVGLRDDIVSEASCRLTGMLLEGRDALDGIVLDGEAQPDAVRSYVYGVVRNIAREMSRQERRHVRDFEISERATATMHLAVLEETPAARVELDDAIGDALAKFNGLNDELRETLVAEEARRNEYSGAAMESLCNACNVSIGKVKTMMNDRENGRVSDAAWRQRIHRLRQRAQRVLADADLFTVSLLWAAIVGAALVVASPATTDADPATPAATSTVDVDVLLASTQNGKPKKG